MERKTGGTLGRDGGQDIGRLATFPAAMAASHGQVATRLADGPDGHLGTVVVGLPVPLSSFVGRQREVERVLAGLSTARMLTIAGPGGSGKTRLAVHVAESLAGRAPGRPPLAQTPRATYFADLSSARTPAGHPEQLLHRLTLGSQEPGEDRHDRAADRLAAQPSLLVLDGCEHLGELPGRLAWSLLQLCPDLVVLATSRRVPLGVPGEVMVRLGGLSVSPPPASAAPGHSLSDAVVLFVERARQVDPDFALGVDLVPLVSKLCGALAGMPLAIELAAARLRMMSVADVDAGLGQRLDLLSRGRRTAVERHRSMRASLQWSYGLLGEGERRVLCAASAFVGGFTLEDLAGVIVDEDRGALPVLADLVEQSLIAVEDRPEGSRYRLLEEVRQFAAERLREAGREEEARVRAAHLARFRVVADASGSLRLTRHGRALLSASEPNMWAALAWAQGTAPEEALALVAGLERWWLQRGGYVEARALCAAALAAAGPDGDPDLRARVLCIDGWLAAFNGRFPEAVGLLPEVLGIAEASDDRGTIGAVATFATLLFAIIDPEQAIGHGQQAVQVLSAVGRRDDLGWALAVLALAQAALEESTAARTLALQSLAIGEEIGDAVLISCAEWVLSVGTMLNGDAATTAGHLARAQRLTRGLMPVLDELVLGARLWVLALIDDPGALRQEVLGRLDREEGVTEIGGVALRNGLAFADLVTGHPARAAVQATPLLECGIPHFQRLARGTLVHAGVAAGDAAAISALTQAPNTASEHALALYGAGWSSLHEGRLSEARSLLHQALEAYLQLDMRLLALTALEAISATATATGEQPLAARLLAAADQERGRLGTRPSVARAALLQKTKDELQTALGAEDLQQAWHEGSALTLREAAQYAGRARGSRQRPAHGTASLTPMEEQVAALAAQGLTNAQIGERLFVSRSTVKVHISRALTKLQVDTRIALAAALTLTDTSG